MDDDVVEDASSLLMSCLKMRYFQLVSPRVSFR
jgi:hypothetical protein